MIKNILLTFAIAFSFSSVALAGNPAKKMDEGIQKANTATQDAKATAQTDAQKKDAEAKKALEKVKAAKAKAEKDAQTQ